MKKSVYFFCFLFFIFFPSIVLSSSFIDKTTDANFKYRSVIADKGKIFHPTDLDNEGIYVADYDRDRWMDLLVVGGTEPILLRNRRGTYQREKSFPEINKKISGALWVDYNRDNWKDLLLVPMKGHPLLLRNDEGTFREPELIDSVKLEAGLGASSGDFNKNGCPDVFILQFEKISKITPEVMKRYRSGQNPDTFPQDNAKPNYLLQGNCRSFKKVEIPAFDRNHWSLASSFVDVNGDGWQDIHVANDYFRDSLYVNKKDGTFEHRYLSPRTNRNGMSSGVVDFNQDGRPDIFVSNMHVDPDNKAMKEDFYRSKIAFNPGGHNVLIKNNGSFEDQAAKYGLRKGGWGWASTWFDYDGDFEFEFLLAKHNLLYENTSIRMFELSEFSVADFVAKTKGSQEIPEHLKSSTQHDLFEDWLGYPQLWDREGDQFFSVPHERSGLSRMNSRSVSSLDYNRDGAPDLVFSQFDDWFKLYENNIESEPEDWIKVKVNSAFQGGTLEITLSDGRRKVIPVTSRTDFHTQDAPIYSVGIGKDTSNIKIEMSWNDEADQKVVDITGGTYVEISKDDTSLQRIFSSRN